MLRDVRAVARKELSGFFASPAAFLFLGAFLGVTLFVFFWVDTFFARNLADVRPLFQWMPVLLIFLVAALTMRSWAEERRSGTLELLLTAPISATELVLGKFVGVLGLVLIALALTLPLPVTVALLGPLDWGPVIGGYVAAVALASAYVAIGLWVSSRTDNQIVSLILTAVIAGGFYLIGAPVLRGLVGQHGADLLAGLGAGSRFASITRGVLDLRDLYYYLSITAAFLVLNRLSVERLRWSGNRAQRVHRLWYWTAGLLVANVLGANLWLDQVRGARLDLTEGRQYTLSDATRNYLGELQEPLLIRGYFSASTHPLLAPLVPQLRDLLDEYAVAGGSKVRVEFVDPHDDPKAEQEAAGKYGIRPVPFQVASKYKASVVNSYFDILVRYGDQFQVLSFRDLIDVKQRSEGDFDVALKNPEYDITRAIRKVLVSYQGGGSPFAALSRPLTFTGYVSGPQGLPAGLSKAREALDAALVKLRGEAGDRLKTTFKDPGTDPALAKRLGDELGLHPLVVGLLDPHSFWFQFTLSDGHQTEQVPLPKTMDEAGFQRSLEAAVKRFSPGYLKTVAVLAPAPAAYPGAPGGAQFSMLREALGESVHWVDADLKDGQVPATADMLMVLAPEHLDDKQVFAIDQFLMQGGSVMLATAPTGVDFGSGIDAHGVTSGLEGWLSGNGLTLSKGMVLDPRSGSLPIPVQRQIGGGLSVREIELAPYPYIVDVRGNGLDSASAITASLGEIEVPWASAVTVDEAKNKGLKVTTLLRSSKDSWLSDSTKLLPDYQQHPDLGFAAAGPRAARPLAVMIEGRFVSAFKGKPSPLLASAKAPDASASAPKPAAAASSAMPAIGRVIDRSPEAARLIVVASDELFNDRTMRLLGEARGVRDTRAVQFAQNLVDWSLQDQGLLGIRGRDHFARTLAPLPREAEAGWEYGNYAAALGGLALVWWLNRRRRRGASHHYAQLLQEV